MKVEEWDKTAGPKRENMGCHRANKVEKVKVEGIPNGFNDASNVDHANLVNDKD